MKLKEILTKKEARLVKVNNKLAEIGMDTVSDPKIANKRLKLRREATDLSWQIKELKTMI